MDMAMEYVRIFILIGFLVVYKFGILFLNFIC